MAHVIFSINPERLLKGISMNNTEVVRRFEHEFKNDNNFDVVDEVMAEDFVHHLPFPGLPEGRAGMKAVGHLITGAVKDITATVDMVVAEGDLVADRISVRGSRAADGSAIDWVENHIYRVVDGQITELWPAGGPALD